MTDHSSSLLSPPEPAAIAAWMRDHVYITIGIAAFWIWVSGALIIRIWTVHRSASTVKKALWSMVVLVPFFGWIFYGGWFEVPPPHGEAVENSWSFV